MRTIIPIIFVLLCVLHFPVAAQTASKTADASEAEIVHTLRERVEVGKTNQSIVVAIIDKNGVRYFSLGTLAPDSSGKANERTVFEIGSITKVFTGTLLAIAVERKEVALNDPISKYLPKEVKTPVFGEREITLLDLATQSSGLPRLPANFAPKNPANPYADYTVAQMYDFLGNYRLPRPPGEKYEYSNFGMGLLGHILSLRAGMSYEQLVKTRILKPLGMKETTITLSPKLKVKMAPGFDQNGDPASLWEMPTLAGAGALRSTAANLAKFIRANLNPGSSLKSAFAEAQLPQRAAGEKMQIGLGWHILSGDAGEIVWHNGGTGGFRSFAGFSGARGIGIVILTNSSESVDDLGFHYLDPQSPLQKIKPALALNAETLDRYVGTYQFAPNIFFIVTRRGDRLFAQLTGQDALRIFASKENEFYYRAVDAQLTFNPSADGQRTESVTLHQNGDQIARKTQ